MYSKNIQVIAIEHPTKVVISTFTTLVANAIVQYTLLLNHYNFKKLYHGTHRLQKHERISICQPL